MNKIEEIASVHLGKAGDGSIVKPYITPDRVDPSLLVAIPRQLNRDHYNINKDTLMHGYDTWNAYEVSFLMDNGYPINVIAKIIYSSESECIVESKSLKLYLNSFNMQKLGKTLHEAIRDAREIIQIDLSNLLQTDVSVELFTDTYFNAIPGESAFRGTFPSLEEILVDIEEMEFPFYNENPDILQIDNETDHNVFSARSNALRSNCRVTNQPDWGDVYIAMEGESIPTYESVLQYIVSMRKENHFHEEICECIYKRLLDKFNPEHLIVGCLYTRRGGIDINPVRATSIDMLLRYSKALMTPGILVNKTMRQ
jgi:7-cyano-7-deazaguanine reductase